MTEPVARGLALRLRHVRRRDRHTVHAVLERRAERLGESKVVFTFELSPADRECIRWYWEDYGDESTLIDPAGAESAQARLREIGQEIFQRVFGSDAEARRLWSRAAKRLDDVRIELASGPHDAPTIPWELMWAAGRGERPVLGARAFVRTTRGLPSTPRPAPRQEDLSVLYVAAPTVGTSATPFRSVATQLLRSASATRERLQVEVLRPPTLDALKRKLNEAAASGRAYDVLHFDGEAMTAARSDEGARLVFATPDGRHHLVSGNELGELLVSADVRALVINAAQVLHEEAPPAPDATPVDVERRPRAFVSVAAAATEAGVPGVVALPYCARSRALEFCSALYEALIEGHTLGEAVSGVRRRMSEGRGWLVPAVVFEPAPLRLVSPHPGRAGIDRPKRASARRKEFIGRDELLLALDRAFVEHDLVLLHGEPGSGKTRTAIEFASWYKNSGALRVDGGGEGALLFSTLDPGAPTARILDELGETFGAVLEGAGVVWMQLDEGDRRDVAAQLLRQVPVLWVWDQADSIAAAPAQRAELYELLAMITHAGAKVLVTSRRSEGDWLARLPHHSIRMPPLPWRDSVALARAIAEREDEGSYGGMDALEPLLRYAGGNPMAIRAMVRLGLRQGIDGRTAAADLVDRLRVEGDAEGAPDSLTAALRHVMRGEFDSEERAVLALLGLFERHVHVEVLRFLGTVAAGMGAAAPDGVDDAAALVALLDRAAASGLIEPLGEGSYGIHDVLAPLFGELFADTYGSRDRNRAEDWRRSWVMAMASVGDYWYGAYRDRRLLDLAPLVAEEQNLLRARLRGMELGLWDSVTSCMNALLLLYAHEGRMAELAPYVDDLAAALVDPGTDEPRLGVEEEWRFVVAYRVSLARATQNLALAVSLQEQMVSWERRRLEDAPGNALVHELARTIEDLGDLVRDQGSEDCVSHYQEAYRLFESIGEARDQAAAAFSIGVAYGSLEALLDYDKADEWFRRSLDLLPEEDRLGQARARAQLGRIAFARGHYDDALSAYRHALEEMPPEATSEMAAVKAQLGNVYRNLGDLESGVASYREAVAHYEQIRDAHGAGVTLYNLAVALGGEGQLDAAVQYAREALRDLETTGDAGRGDADDARRLVGILESMKATAAP